MANTYFTDRVVQYPGRVTMTPTGNENEYDLARAEGNVTEAGTPFNADTFNEIANQIIADAVAEAVPEAVNEVIASEEFTALETKVAAAQVRTGSVTGNIVKTAGRSVSLTAPDITGYTFVCWIMCTTNAWTGYVTPSNPTLKTVNFYVQYSASPSTSTGGITAFALYRRS